MAAMDGTSITYSDRSCEGCKKAAVSRSKHRVKKFESDPDAMHGPPDRQTHFKKSTTTKRYITNESLITIVSCWYKQLILQRYHINMQQILKSLSNDMQVGFFFKDVNSPGGLIN